MMDDAVNRDLECKLHQVLPGFILASIFSMLIFFPSKKEKNWTKSFPSKLVGSKHEGRPRDMKV